MNFTFTVRLVVDAPDGKNAMALVNDLLRSLYLPKFEIITIAAGDKVNKL